MAKNTTSWTLEVKALVKSIHSELSLNEKNWHKFKNNKYRRSAELLSGALSQIINDGKQDDIEGLIEQSLHWIREEIKDPGCPSH
ncbi:MULTISPECIES: DUF6439 family protein [unclassified Prochlorococcus]|uniref:DUF6439 family protein n=1 Tax=unclassified Prochlorococcus TaxID=2627481 RepID=UPI0005338819|nr:MULTISPECIES: DUF6439 family protein [unclassified Prochlorococcus]KGG15090.1 hypothetical protein EV06_0954 [Prochlorococcus sp. MIT 0602]KGG17362.1 hypothetical protein EV07_0800 [Prochlorococcus sp. MIT 0603]